MAAVTAADIETKLKTGALQASFVEAVDLSDGCGAKFDVVTVSAAFEGKPLIARHRAVNNELSQEMKSIHALTLKTYTPQQWEDIKAKQGAA